jgi:hypothetical protein
VIYRIATNISGYTASTYHRGIFGGRHYIHIPSGSEIDVDTRAETSGVVEFSYQGKRYTLARDLVVKALPRQANAASATGSTPE